MKCWHHYYSEGVKKMSKVVKNIMLRVIRKRMAEGETVEEILADYPKLTEEEKQELTEAL